MFVVLFLASCGGGNNVDTPYSLPKLRPSKDYFKVRNMLDIGQMVDTSFTKTSDLRALVDAKQIDELGKVTSISIDKAMELYEARAKLKYPSYPLPIFEVKNSTKSILFVRGKGLWGPIWAKVLIDQKTKIIAQVVISHQGETPGNGAEISSDYFEGQFIGAILTEQKWSFYLNVNSAASNQTNNIDGFSGGTISCEGAVMAMNLGLHLYNTYFFEEINDINK